MNVKLYKLKFDKSRGEYVAVSEITSSHSSGMGGTQMADGGIALEAQLKPVARSVLNSIASGLAGISNLSGISNLTNVASFGLIAGALGLTGLSAATVATAADVLPNNLPSGGQIVAGQGAIQNTSSNVLTVQQNSQKLITNWQSFNVGAGHTVIFNQPNSSSVALNRVLGNSRSDIAGTIQSNGQVYLLNPNGVLFSSTSQVNVGSLVAGTHAISDADFMNGRLNFTNGGAGGSISGADVVNEGHLTVAEGGHVVLMGESVKNNGTITANGGQVVLSAGDKISLAQSGSNSSGGNLLSVTVTEASIRALVENKGLIVTNGGQVYLTAHGRDMLSTTVVNNSGVIRANSLGVVNGEIVLDGGESGAVVNSGTLDASGLNAGETGGTVKMAGQYVGLLDSGKIDARGDAGGGKVLVGGDYQGKDSADYQNTDGTALRKADVVLLNSQAVIDASAVNAGKGGKVILWSDKYTNFEGNILAKGGQTGGDGGFVETSSKENLQAFGRVDAKAGGKDAKKGKAGQWLLDPTDVTISATVQDIGGAQSSGTWDFGLNSIATINNATIESSLNSGTNVTITTNTTGTSGTGNIVISSNINKTLGGDANLNVTANGSISISGANITSIAGLLNINLTAATEVLFTNASLSTNGGSIDVIGGGRQKTVFTNSSVVTGNGNLTVSAPALSMSFDNTINVGTGTALLTGSNTGAALNALEFVRGTTTTTGATTFKGNSASAADPAVDVYSANISSTDNQLNITSNYTGSTVGFLGFRIGGDTVSIDSSLNNVSLTVLGGGGSAVTATHLNISGNVNITSINGISSASVWGTSLGKSVNLSLNVGTTAVNLTDSANAIRGTVSVASASSLALNNTLSFSLGAVSASGDIAISSNRNLTLNGIIQSASGNVTLTAGNGAPLNLTQLNGGVSGGDVIKGSATSVSAGGLGKTVQIYSGNADSANLSSLVINGASSQNKSYRTIVGAGTVDATRALNLFYRVAPNLSFAARDVTLTYDGMTTLGPGLGSLVLATGLIDGDRMIGNPEIKSSGTALVNGGARNVGTYLINVSGITEPVSGYVVTRTNANLTINKANITGINGVAFENREYNGTSDATLNTSAASFIGIFGNDVLNITSSKGAFDNKNVGTNKAVNMTDVILGGADSANYQIAPNLLSINVAKNASITQATLIAKAPKVIKIYDGTNKASGAPILSGLKANDTLVSSELAFSDFSIGTKKTVNITSLTIEDGNQGKNYLVVRQSDSDSQITAPKPTPFNVAEAQYRLVEAKYYVAPLFDEKAVNRMFRIRGFGTKKIAESEALQAPVKVLKNAS